MPLDYDQPGTEPTTQTFRCHCIYDDSTPFPTNCLREFPFHDRQSSGLFINPLISFQVYRWLSAFLFFINKMSPKTIMSCLTFDIAITWHYLKFFLNLRIEKEWKTTTNRTVIKDNWRTRVSDRWDPCRKDAPAKKCQLPVLIAEEQVME